MDFFNSLTLDLKMLLVGIAGCALLALFSGNHKAEKRYLIVLALLTAGGVYRFTHLPGQEPAQAASSTRAVTKAAPAPTQHKPLVSTSAK